MKVLRSLLATIVESAPFAILVVDRGGCIQFVNRGAERLFGYVRDALVGASIELLVPRAARASHRRHRSAFSAHPAQRPMANGRALEARRSDGSTVPVEVALKPIEYGSAPYVLAIVVDVSERCRLERVVVEAHEELERRIDERTAELARTTAEKERLLRDLERKSRELERLSLEDPLTALSNRRDLDRRLDDWVRTSVRSAAPLSVAMFDLDHFKQVNDRFGHAAGDEVLKETADLLRRECRAIGVVARYGGEEFALVFPGVGPEHGRAICERIRAAYAQADWSRCAPGLALTISAGLAGWHGGMDRRALLAAADAAMYEAKRQGRNRVVVRES